MRSPPDTRQGGFAMDEFVERQNITHYVDQLKTEKDPTKRAMLERLLAEEKAKQAHPPRMPAAPAYGFSTMPFASGARRARSLSI